MWREHFAGKTLSGHFFCFMIVIISGFFSPNCEGAPWFECPIMRQRLNAPYSHVAWETLMWLHKSKRIRSSTRKIEAGYSRRSTEYSYRLIAAYWLRQGICRDEWAWGADLRPTSFGHWQSSGTNQAGAELNWAEIRLRHYPLLEESWRVLRLH